MDIKDTDPNQTSKAVTNWLKDNKGNVLEWVRINHKTLNLMENFWTEQEKSVSDLSKEAHKLFRDACGKLPKYLIQVTQLEGKTTK